MIPVSFSFSKAWKSMPVMKALENMTVPIMKKLIKASDDKSTCSRDKRIHSRAQR